MPRTLHLDFETRGLYDIGGQKGVGLWNYFNALGTDVLMLAWKFAGSTTQLWQPHLGPMSQELVDGLKDESVLLSAFNSAFERYCLKFKLGYDIPPERFIDPQVGARYLALPADLDSVCSILGVPEHLAKDKRGEKLIDLFCIPQTPRKKKGEERGPQYFNDWNSHPEEWKLFEEYCKKDVDAEEEVYRRLEILQAMPMPEFERKLWCLDQRINDRGMPVDVGFTQKAYKLAQRAKEEALENQNKLTGLENANSTQQLLPWARERGYPYNTLNKSFVEATLKDPGVQLTELCRQVLTARLTAGSNSYTKLAAILRQICPDGRLRNQFIYLGSSRCGRWAGNSVQLQNLPRPAPPSQLNGHDFEDLSELKAARQFVYAEDYDGIQQTYGNVLSTIKSLLRTVFVAPPGYRFNVADLASIETRVCAWIAQCDSLLKVFRDNKDAYLDLAAKMYSIPYEKLWADFKGQNGKDAKGDAKRKRQVAKPGVLGAVYRLGGGDWGWGKASYIDPETGEKIYDRVRTGLWGYAHAMNVEMTREEAHFVVQIFRQAYSEIPALWKAFEEAVADVLKGTNTVRRIGPNGCIIIDKLNIEGRGDLMRITLPSGRRLHYLDAHLEILKMPWIDSEGKPVYREGLVYATEDQITGRWSTTVSHGGKLTENATQAIARDILAVMLMRFEENDMPVVGHVHDEGVSLVQDDIFSPTIEDMVADMSKSVFWAPNLVLGADGFQGDFYRK